MVGLGRGTGSWGYVRLHRERFDSKKANSIPILSFNCSLVQRPHRRRRWQPTPVLLPGKSHGRRSLVGCSPWSREESYTTERLHFHFSLSCIGEGNGNPLQCSCLENPRDRGASWVAVCGVVQSRTRLKRLSSSSSKNDKHEIFKNVCGKYFNFRKFCWNTFSS